MTSDSPTTPPSDTSPSDAIPMAQVQPARGVGMLYSHMWWVTLVCLGIACYLAWQSHRPHGEEITIHFPEGHGLKEGDALRHRGIDIGIVTSVGLAQDLHQVRTTVAVDPTAEGIAVEGSQFWIVRPQFSLTNISGLETAVGAKYIAVAPGALDGPYVHEFDGLPSPPATEMDSQGVEVRLRADQSFGINPSSPVTYRGIVVGQILSVELTEDSREVEVIAQVETQYKALLRESSQFWKTSGVDVDFGLRGFHLSTESLAALAKGGVSFLTPSTRDGAHERAVESGHVFVLHEKRDDDWLDDPASIPLPSE